MKWIDVFHDPDLKRLIEEGLRSNYDVRIAVQRVLEQQARLGITRSQLFPTLSLGGSEVGASLPSGAASAAGLHNVLAAGSLSLSAAWTPDFWGLYRRQNEQARAGLLAQRWAQRAVTSTLIANLAAAYLQLRALDAQLAVTREALKVREDSLRLTEHLEHSGAATMSDVRESQALVFTASSNIPALEQQIQEQENQIRLLLGRQPGSITRRETYTPSPNVASVPAGIPSQLLERRPDIQEAEANLIAANAAIGVARAQFFPTIPISGSGGIGSNSLGTLFDPSGAYIYGVGSLVQPLFEGGRLRNNLRLVQETDQEVVLTYQQTIAAAFRDVSNALIAYRKTREYREQQEQLVAADQDASHLAEVRYKGGAATYLEVLTNEANRYNAELGLVTAQQNESLALVQLYNALGGGWQ